jgi:hypothetical protein
MDSESSMMQQGEDAILKICMKQLFTSSLVRKPGLARLSDSQHRKMQEDIEIIFEEIYQKAFEKLKEFENQ